MAHQPGTCAVREGRCALLQGLATCGRKLAVYNDGEYKATPANWFTRHRPHHRRPRHRSPARGGAPSMPQSAKRSWGPLQPLAAEAELARRPACRAHPPPSAPRPSPSATTSPASGTPSTSDKDRKPLLRTSLEEVCIVVHRDDLVFRWIGAAIT